MEIYCAVLEKDCNAHYFKNLGSAIDYITGGKDVKFEYDSFCHSLVYGNIGYIDIIQFEDI